MKLQLSILLCAVLVSQSKAFLKSQNHRIIRSPSLIYTVAPKKSPEFIDTQFFADDEDSAIGTYQRVKKEVKRYAVAQKTEEYTPYLKRYEALSKPFVSKFESQQLSVTGRRLLEFVKYSYPFVVPFAVFHTFEGAMSLFHDIINIISIDVKWVMVDGGQYQATILAPTINGVVLPTLSISLATLVAQTITNLRQRENAIRTCLNKEVSDMRTLQSAVESIFGGTDELRAEKYNLIVLMAVYMSRVFCESQAKSTAELRNTDKVLSPVNSELYTMSKIFGIYQRPPSAGGSSLDAGFAQSLIVGLNGHRSLRLASLDTVFPPIHWLFLCLLATSVLACFLLESDQETILFLDNVQLRLLFTMLVGGMSFTALLCIDLLYPFGKENDSSSKLLLELRTSLESV
jgi:hypothetical protein